MRNEIEYTERELNDFIDNSLVTDCGYDLLVEPSSAPLKLLCPLCLEELGDDGNCFDCEEEDLE